MNVIVRARVPTDPTAESAVIAESADSIAVVKDGGVREAFKVSKALRPEDSNATAFTECILPSVQRMYEGADGCVFAYGQTGSGKTFTITGNDEHPGMLPQTIQYLLNRVKDDPAVESACVLLSYVEVHNENIRDLLAISGAPSQKAREALQSQSLQLLDDKYGNSHLPGVTQIAVGSVSFALAAMKRAESFRATGANSVHEHASRSHSVFTLTLEARRTDTAEAASPGGSTTPPKRRSISPSAAGLRSPISDAAEEGANPNAFRISTLHLVDLAGSEKMLPGLDHDATEVVERRKDALDIANAQAQEAEQHRSAVRNREGSHIRKSLLALVRCVGQLAQRANFVSYRESKLTRLLRSSLEHNRNTTIVCTVNPVEPKESLNTIRFALTAATVPASGESLGTRRVSKAEADASVLRSLESQINSLKSEFSKSLKHEHSRAEDLEKESVQRKQALDKLDADRGQLLKRVSELERLLAVTSGRGGNTSLEDRIAAQQKQLDAAAKREAALKAELDAVKKELKQVSRGNAECGIDEATLKALPEHPLLYARRLAVEVYRAQQLLKRADVAFVEQRESAREAVDRHTKKGGGGMCTGGAPPVELAEPPTTRGLEAGLPAPTEERARASVNGDEAALLTMSLFPSAASGTTTNEEKR